VLYLPALAAAAAWFGSAELGRAAAATGATPAPVPPDGRLTWDQFLTQCVPVATELHADPSPGGQDAYLYALATRAVRVAAAPADPLRPFAGLDPEVRFGLSHKGFPFIVVQWQMEPGSILPAHCHPHTSVCTLGLAGQALLRHFELEPGAPAFDAKESRPLRMRETRSQIITAGRISTLSATRDNIHYFVAGPGGARGIDITTSYGGDGSFSFIDFPADQPVDPRQRIYEGRWIGSKLG
jgi:hypothetical protein